MIAPQGPDETYQVEDVQEILQLAIARRDTDGELTRSQLEEIAADLGITQTDLVAAEQAWLDIKVETTKKQEFNLYRQQLLKNRVIRFGIINGFLIGLDTLSTSHPTWSLYILMIWGLFFTLRSWRLWQTSGPEYEAEFEKWDRKMQLKESVQTLWQRTQKFLKGIS